MGINRKSFGPVLALFLAVLSFSIPAFAASVDEPILVGRIGYIEGQVLRYIPDNKDWVATVKDAPFGINDALYSDQVGRGEFIMPNGIWTRIGGTTQIQLIVLKNDICDMDVAAGVARFYNKSPNAALKVTTPYGYILSEPGSSFDLYVGDQSLEVLALDGKVEFIHATNTRYEVAQGSGSIIASADRAAAGDSTVDASWDDWNATRDSLWSKRTQVKGDSITYLPPQLHDDAYEFEQNGKWERVYYEGEYRNYWRPTHVADDWRPFTVGRWTEWYGDQCWVPDEPFGYVTHHYGNWVIIGGRWFWAPPVPRVAVVTAVPVIDYGWYPGRVAWISSGPNIGWVPLAPSEVYYSHRHWGPQAVVIGAAPVAAITVGALAFAGAAVIVPQTHFWGVRDYSRVQVANIDRTMIINNYRTAPAINTVIPNYSTAPNRYNFTPMAVAAKPHVEVLQRIEHNQLAIQQAPRMNAAMVKQEAIAAKAPSVPLQLQQQIKLPPPQVTNKIVPSNMVTAPKNQIQFKAADIKVNPKPAPISTPAFTGAPGGRPALPGTALPSGVKPVAPGLTNTVPGAVTQPTLQGRPTPPAFKPATPLTQPSVTGPSGIPSPRTQLPPPTFKGNTGTTQTPAGVMQPGATGGTMPKGTAPTLRTMPSSPSFQGTQPKTLNTQPLINSPSATRPRYNAPLTTQPRYNAPVTQPRITAPSVTQPKFNAPSVTQPKFTSPSVTQPRFTAPAVTQPRFTAPPVTQPKFNAPVTQPRFTAPAVTQPRFTAPAVTQPRFNAPVTQPKLNAPPVTRPPVAPQINRPVLTAPPVKTPPANQQKKKPGEPGYVPGQ